MNNHPSASDSGESRSNQELQNDLDDIRNTYQTLPQMIAFEGQKPWNALSVFIQLSFVLAAGAIVPNILPGTNDAIGPWVGLLLSFCGIFATIIWISFDMRYRKITKYWVLSIRELEEKISVHVIAYQRGKDFADGEKVEVSGETIKYNIFERLPVRTGFLIIYLVFLLVFILLALYNIFRLT